MPRACIFAIFSLAGLEKLHSSMLQLATESGHPHWHLRRAPTRRVSTLGFSAAVCAHASAPARASNATRQTIPMGRRAVARGLAECGKGSADRSLAVAA